MSLLDARCSVILAVNCVVLSGAQLFLVLNSCSVSQGDKRACGRAAEPNNHNDSNEKSCMEIGVQVTWVWICGIFWTPIPVCWLYLEEAEA
uniref:Uncharacterized protein n=1 Tax=Aegilops tauschii subsp. strangulata TaxID=200361 RepID=A0A453NSA7_AEGTS